MVNVIVDAIKGKCKVKYSSQDNPIDVQYVRVSQMKSVMSLLSDMALNEDLDCNAEGFGIICRMVSEELDDIVTKLDKANLEICRAISGEDDDEKGAKKTSNLKGPSAN